MGINFNSANGIVQHFSKNSAPTGFSRLKRIFTNGLNYATYDEIVLSAKRKVLGNIPEDILAQAIQMPNKKEVILNIQNGFAQAAQELTKVDKIRIQKLKSKPQTELKTILSENILNITEKQQKILTSVLPQSKTTQIEQKAANKIKESMKGLLPDSASVKLTYLGEGMYGKGYKVEFTDKAGNKLFKDRVLKLYKNGEYQTEILTDLHTLQLEILRDMPIETIVQKIKSDKYFCGCNDTEIEDMAAELKELAQNSKIEDIRSFVEEIIDAGAKMHGVAAEANSAQYIQRAAGHPLTHTNLNEQNMFDLEHYFSISPYVSNSDKKMTRIFNLENIGIRATDNVNDKNTVAGKIIDFGGMRKIHELLTDKVIMRYYKKIKNRPTAEETTAFIEQLTELCKNPKTPNRNKILQAIEIFKRETAIAAIPVSHKPAKTCTNPNGKI